VSGSVDGPQPRDGRAWDLLVLGGGTAGMLGAKAAAGFGADVLLVERDRTGGDCLWTGCVPSKSILAAAAAAADARRATRLGVHVDGVRVDFAAVMGHVRAAIAAIEPADSPDALRAAGVRVLQGTARLTGPGAADVGGTPVRFRRALLATGSAPALPPIPGLNRAGALTSDTVWSLTVLPPRLLVLGGGGIGCELGQAFARLGSAVTVVEALPRLLSREDADAAALITDALAADGVRVLTGVAVEAVRPDGHTGAGTAELSDGGTVGYDRVLVAVGRRPRTAELGLDAAGVTVDERGYVRVDAALRTSNPRIWAAGDVTGNPQFTHVAGVHGTVAAVNAILGLRRRVALATIPRVTFTQPELAAFGVGAGQAAPAGLTIRTVEHREVDRAVTEAATAGFTRLVLDSRGRVLGATILGPRAGESLAEVVLAARHGLRSRAIGAAMHAYPTYGDGVWKAALADVEQRLGQGMTRGAIRFLASARRGWLAAHARPRA
jgi:pyruvate/2-oxoglutarate dehydrogenase complex dihydrolipoamide dehydrogenase (E3) component